MSAVPRRRRLLPLHIPGTMRQFRARKRGELRRLERAFMGGMWLAGAWCPEAERLDEIRMQLTKLRRAWSVARWGR